MASADRRLVPLLALLLGAAANAQPAQQTPRLDSQAPAPLLHPRIPGADDAPGQVLLADSGYAANAAVARIVVELDRDGVPADGQSPVQAVVRLYGADGKPLAGTAFVTIEVSGGRVLLPGARSDEAGPRGLDGDRAVPGVQLKVQGGEARFTLLAPDRAQDVRLRVSAGAEQAAGVVRFVPELRPMVAAGLVEGVLHLRNASLQPVQRGDVFEREIRMWSRAFDSGKANVAARTAFYLKGTVRGDLLLTAAYDSDKDTRARLLREIRPDEVYPVYGDASLRSTDARSTGRLYVRIDKDRSYLLLGDFVTGDGFTQPQGLGGAGAQAQGLGSAGSLKQRSLGQTNRSATGVRAHHEDGGFSGNAFAFHDSLRQVVQEFSSQGSGPYGLANNAVLEGSEKVEVLVRDRAQPARILSVQALQPLVDYSFEPFSGRILLNQFLPAVDAQLNPVSLRVSYEVDQGGPGFWVAGADAQWQLHRSLELGGSLVRDDNPLSPYDLASANATLRLGPRTALVAELARSQATVNTNPANQVTGAALGKLQGEVAGNAWRIEGVHEGESLKARAFVGRSAVLFHNPAAPLNGGRGEAAADLRWQFAPAWALTADALRSEDRSTGGGTRTAGGLGLQWAVTERLTLDAGLRRHRETIGSLANGWSTQPFGDTTGLSSAIGSGAAGGALGYGNQAIDPATGLAVIGGGGLTQAASPLPLGTRLASDTLRLGASWRATDRLRLGVEAEADIRGETRQRLGLGADWLLTERTRLYGRIEQQRGWVSLAGTTDRDRRANAVALGAASTVLQDTQVFSEYRLRDAISGRDAQVASGIRQGFDLAEGLRATVGLEQIHVLSGSTAKATGIALGLEDTRHPLWKGSTRLEWRRSGDIADTPTDERFTTTLWQVMAARKLDRDWTLLARNHLLVTDYAARGDVLQDRAQLGLAWRPVDHNRFNALAKLEYRHERDGSNAAAGTLSTQAWTVSTHADWHPSRPWWWTGRLAAKWQRDRLEGGVPSRFNARLLAGRVVYDITERWDIGALAAVQWGQGARQQALGAEAGYLLQQNLWLSAGVNWSGFRGDADLAGDEYTLKGAYLRLRFKFDETLWRRGDPQINRTLDR